MADLVEGLETDTDTLSPAFYDKIGTPRLK